MNKGLKRVLVSAMALSLIVPVTVPQVNAAAKPKLSSKTVTVKVGKTKKVTVKNVKAKKIKKTTWTAAKKSIVKLSAKKKNSVTVKGVKAGKSAVTAKVKVGKKTYTLKTTINVKKASKPVKTPDVTPSNTSPTESTKPNESSAPTNAPTPAPSVRTLTPVAVVEVPKKDADTFPTTPPQAAIDEATKVAYSADFENIPLDTKSEDAVTGAGIEGVVLRGHGKDADGGAGTSKDYLQVVDGENLPVNGNKSHVLYCHRESKTWQGPMMDITSKLEEGCTYELKADVYCQNTDLMCSYQEQTVEELSAGYGNFGVNNVETKIPMGKWNTVKYEISVPDDKYYYGLYFESFNGVGNDDIYIDNITLTKVFQVKPDKSIPKLKDIYKDVFPIVGVGAGISSILGKNGSEFIADHFNGYTPGNEMKPDAILGATPGKIVKPDEEESDNTDFLTIADAKSIGYIIPDDYASFEENHFKNGTGEVAVPRLKFDKVDAIMKACHEKGVKLRGHTLVWHQQTPVFFFQQYYKTTKGEKYNVSRDCMDSRLEFYIKSVLEHILTSPYADCLYGYDVVNEYLHSRNAEKDGKYPSYYGLIYDTYDDNVNDHRVTLFPSYLKDAFTWAHEMLVKHNRTDVKLFYNDYNCYQRPSNIIHLTDYINSDGKVCDGIGMQAHLDITDKFHSPSSFASALELFRVNSPELEIQITELDAGMNSEKATDQDQAAYYDQIMNAILTNKKKGGNITGFILWSLYDGVSWRAQNYPCVYNGLYMPKSSFYAVIDAKKEYWG